MRTVGSIYLTFMQHIGFDLLALWTSRSTPPLRSSALASWAYFIPFQTPTFQKIHFWRVICLPGAPQSSPDLQTNPPGVKKYAEFDFNTPILQIIKKQTKNIDFQNLSFYKFLHFLHLLYMLWATHVNLVYLGVEIITKLGRHKVPRSPG